MSNYITNHTAQKDLVYDLFSPKDDLSIYHSNPLEYITIVRNHLEDKKLRTYSLPELIKVEDQFKTAYSSLSDEQKNEHLDACSDAVGQLFDLQVEKTEVKKSLIEQDFLSPKDSPADYLNPLDYITVVRESISAGKMDTYSLAELQEVEDKFKEAYAQLSDKKKEIYLEDCVDTIMDLSKLYVKEDKRLDKVYQVVADLSNDLMDNADEGIETILNDYKEVEFKNNKPQDYQPGHAEITVEEQEIDAEELNDILSIEEDSANPALNDLLAKYNPENWGGYKPEKYPRTPALSSDEDKSFKAYCVTSLLAKAVPRKVHEKKVIVKNSTAAPDSKSAYTPQIEYDVDVSEFYVDVPKKNLKNVVVAFPTKKKSKVLSFLAKAAVVVGLGFGVMGNYDALNQAADAPQKADYHGTPSAEMASSVTSAKASVKSSETKKVEKEMPSAAPKAVVVLPTKKAVKRFPPGYNSQAGNYHAIEKGDTLAGLYEDYAARGGTLSRSDYFKTIRMTNPQIENISTIYAGQVVQEPN
ncbi:MAG: hypothetical protein Q8R47_06645 [Nanoarchaeota archaeon]|nr:hypothetical protein [Nanoarchaeota archaeon]